MGLLVTVVSLSLPRPMVARTPPSGSGIMPWRQNESKTGTGKRSFISR
jgi:hypothetical protein